MTTRDAKGQYTGRSDEQKRKEARMAAYQKVMVETGDARAAEIAAFKATPQDEQ